MTSFQQSRRQILHGLSAIITSTMASGCSHLLTSVTKLNSKVDVRSGVAYGTHPRQKLDIYLPETFGPRPAINLFLYGGSWQWGSRNRYAFVGYALAKRGLAVALADYRLYPEVRFPVFNEDAAQAAAWLLENHNDFGFDQSLNIIGHSAGAHIGASIIVDPQYLNAYNISPSHIKKFVGLSGPYGFKPSTVALVADIFSTARPETAAIPLSLVKKIKTKMLLLHGDADNIVSPKNSYAMAEAVMKHGGSAKLKIYPNVGHRGIILAITEPFSSVGTTLEDTLSFLTA